MVPVSQLHGVTALGRRTLNPDLTFVTASKVTPQ